MAYFKQAHDDEPLGNEGTHVHTVIQTNACPWERKPAIEGNNKYIYIYIKPTHKTKSDNEAVSSTVKTMPLGASVSHCTNKMCPKLGVLWPATCVRYGVDAESV